jgi:DNA-directed RNA polymerase specialized sigma24 family protein
LRRVTTDRLLQLHGRGVLDDDQLIACVWYRRRWEETGLATGPQTSKLAPSVRGDPARDHLPRTEAAWESWHLYRYARDGVPADVRALFELVVLDGLGMKAAARASNCRYANSAAAFRRGALALHETIRHLLPVRQL